MSTPTLLFIILAAIVVAFILVYNGLVAKKVSVKNAWSQIDVQLKRRHDLVPNLVETVKGYAKHEQETLEKVIQARQTAVQVAGSPAGIAEQSHAENMLSGALRQLFALSESYPDLKANQNFLNLQEELTSTENRIGFARQHYNDSVAAYNTALEQFPGNFVAGFGSFKKSEFYELDPAEAQAAHSAPKVSF